MVKKSWYCLVSVSYTNTLAFDIRYRYRWISNIDTSIGIAGEKTMIFTDTSLSIFDFQN